jgi:hypothetical protein
MKFINDNFLNTPDELEISSSSLIPYTHGWTEKKNEEKRREKRAWEREREKKGKKKP